MVQPNWFTLHNTLAHDNTAITSRHLAHDLAASPSRVFFCCLLSNRTHKATQCIRWETQSQTTEAHTRTLVATIAKCQLRLASERFANKYGLLAARIERANTHTLTYTRRFWAQTRSRFIIYYLYSCCMVMIVSHIHMRASLASFT